jgi:peptide/nickel transport system permease protein
MDVLEQPNVNVVGDAAVASEIVQVLARKRKSQLRLIAERYMRNRLAVAGLVVLGLMALAAIFAPLLTHQTASFDPAYTPTDDIFAPFSLQHPLGTDDLGRDVLARMLLGARVSLSVGVSAVVVAMLIGATIGAIAGYYGGIIDTLLMRFTDMVLAVPYLLILFVLSLTFADHSFKSIVLLIAAFGWADVSRLVRGEFLSLKEREFVLAARTIGAGDFRLIVRHILPNAAATIIVAATLGIGNAIISESVLSFFGFGLAVPLASWGVMLADSQTLFAAHPILLWAPGVAILLTVLCVNLIGDGLRDALDPYMTER